jgi:glutathione synthase/RimK-type ligase-like ATP-grasp enzyme
VFVGSKRVTFLSKIAIFSYNPHSQGAKALSQKLGIKRIKHGHTSYVGAPGKTVINWGSGKTLPFPLNGCRVLNLPQSVALVSNKLSFFKQAAAAGNVRLPEWTADATQAKEWLAQGDCVVARTILSGHSGDGIVILETPVDFVQAPLYTKYVKKEQEFRIHCFKDQGVVDEQRKIKRPDFVGEPNWKVRNHQNGFIYVRDNIVVPEDVRVQALAALQVSGLDFGAVDVLWNKHEQKAYVLEINTAPGITGRSVQSYQEAILKSCSLP